MSFPTVKYHPGDLVLEAVVSLGERAIISPTACIIIKEICELHQCETLEMEPIARACVDYTEIHNVQEAA